MKQKFAAADAITELKLSVTEAVTAGEMTSAAAPVIEDILTRLMVEDQPIEEKHKLIDQMKKHNKDGNITEEAAIVLLMKSTTLMLQLTNSSLRETIERVKHSSDIAELEMKTPVNRRPI